MAQIDAGLTADVEAWGGEIVTLPPGPYQLRVKAADVEEKKDKEGNPRLQLVVESEVLSGAFAGKNPKSWYNIPRGNDKAAETARKRLKSLIVACNVPVDGAGNFDTNQLIGCKYNADVIHDTYESGADPLTGKTVQKTAVRIVNERAYGAIASPDNKPANGQGAVSPASGLPGLTKA